MKKTYIAPQVGEAIISINGMVCTSEVVVHEGNAAEQGITEADSRRRHHYDVWDDEEGLEEEEF